MIVKWIEIQIVEFHQRAPSEFYLRGLSSNHPCAKGMKIWWEESEMCHSPINNSLISCRNSLPTLTIYTFPYKPSIYSVVRPASQRNCFVGCSFELISSNYNHQLTNGIFEITSTAFSERSRYPIVESHII